MKYFKRIVGLMGLTALLTGCGNTEIIGEVYGPEHEYIRIGDDTYTVCYDSEYSAKDREKKIGKVEFTNIDTDLMTVYSVDGVEDMEYIYTVWGYDGAFYKKDDTETSVEPDEEEKEEENSMNRYESENFTFYKVEQEKLLGGTYHWVRGVYDEYYQSEYHGLFIGQVVTLFGSENMTSDNEALYSCAVAAENKDGEVVYLEVYYGPSGPAIGGQDGEVYEKAAKELDAIIRATVPMDFETTSVYEDLGVTIRMGTKDGVGYYETEMDELGEFPF